VLGRLLVWSVIPALSRLLLRRRAIREGSWQLPWQGRLALEGFGWSQDALFVLEGASVAWLLASSLPPGGLSLAVESLLFAWAQTWILWDSLLQRDFGLRLNRGMLAELKRLRKGAPFEEALASAWAFGGYGKYVVAVPAMLVLSAMLFGQLPAAHAASWPWSLAAGGGVVVGLLLFMAGCARGCAGLQLHASNSLVELQLGLFERRAAPPRPVAARQPELAFRQQEEAETSARHPLYRFTRSFRGTERFRIRVEPGERPHVLFVSLESFRGANVGALGGKPAASPNFDRLAESGVHFTSFHCNGIITAPALFSAWFGIPPPFSAAYPETAAQANNLISLAEVLGWHDYLCACFDGMDKLTEARGPFLRRHGWHELHCGKDVRERLPQALASNWYVHDEALFGYFADWLAHQQARKQPTFSTVLTMSNHFPWLPPPGERPQRPQTLAERFVETFRYTDQSLGRLVGELEQRGLANDVILFVFGDHGMLTGEHGHVLSILSLCEEVVRIPLLILAPGRLEKPALITDVASQVDLLPTVLDILHLQAPQHALGRSLVRESHVPATAYLTNPLFGGFCSLRRGDRRYARGITSEQEQLLRLSPGSLAAVDVTDEHEEELAALREEALGTKQWLTDAYAADSFVDPSAWPAIWHFFSPDSGRPRLGDLRMGLMTLLPPLELVECRADGGEQVCNIARRLNDCRLRLKLDGGFVEVDIRRAEAADRHCYTTTIAAPPFPESQLAVAARLQASLLHGSAAMLLTKAIIVMLGDLFKGGIAATANGAWVRDPQTMSMTLLAQRGAVFSPPAIDLADNLRRFLPRRR
jgi:hypothetical protein